ncbi:MAG: hypothetical protein MUF57_05860 [Gammaproteobacteria bacterium]|nr:hypothetical protein [Gammaproteobacteria bacterium]
MIRSEQPASVSPFLPLLLVVAAVTLGAGLQTVQLLDDGSTLFEQHAAQEPRIETSKKLRAQLEGISAGLAKLAGQGNANAKKMVEELKARGITVRAPTEAKP